MGNVFDPVAAKTLQVWETYEVYKAYTWPVGATFVKITH